jgi:hypothetical protein
MKYKAFLLHKIRSNHSRFFGEKSVRALNNFFDGYNFRCRAEAWEKSTGRNFFESFGEAMSPVAYRSAFEPFDTYDDAIEYLKFAEFVHSYYGRPISSNNGIGLIREMCNSESEIFYKYLELRIAFLKQESDNKVLQNWLLQNNGK